MPKLKPCPFCGGDVYTRVEILTDYTLQFSITCKKCCTKKEHRLSICDTDFDNVVGAMKIVTYEWNRRTNDAKTD